MDYLPQLVERFGQVAADAAVEWYQTIRPDNIAGYTATPAQPFTAEQVRSELTGKQLWADSNSMRQYVSEAIQRWIRYADRQTIARNVKLDPAKPRYARVPTGSETCAFCMVLASRGFVYHSETSAGQLKTLLGYENYYHNNCDCSVVPQWDAQQAHIEGYDPDKDYDRYRTAADSIAAGTLPQGWLDDMQAQGIPTDAPYNMNTLTYVMRRMYPDAVSDGTGKPHGDH